MFGKHGHWREEVRSDTLNTVHMRQCPAERDLHDTLSNNNPCFSDHTMLPYIYSKCNARCQPAKRLPCVV